jgi:uncharacterized protein YxeA
MKKVFVLLTLAAFIAAGIFAMTQVSAKVFNNDVKIEKTSFDQDPTKSKDKDPKKDNKTTTAPKAETEKSTCAPKKTEGCATKASCTPAQQKSCCSKSADPNKK